MQAFHNLKTGVKLIGSFLLVTVVVVVVAVLGYINLKSINAGMTSMYFDRLVPIAVADRIRSLRSDIDLLIVPGAAHFPFWTHRDEVAEFLRNFLLRAPA